MKIDTNIQKIINPAHRISFDDFLKLVHENPAGNETVPFHFFSTSDLEYIYNAMPDILCSLYNIPLADVPRYHDYTQPPAASEYVPSAESARDIKLLHAYYNDKNSRKSLLRYCSMSDEEIDAILTRQAEEENEK